MMTHSQAPKTVLMVRPHHFETNSETEHDNAFQKPLMGNNNFKRQAYEEVSTAAETLSAAGVEVILFEDEDTKTPDSVFPNNWFSTHSDGKIIVYPMCHPSRRPERRKDIIDTLLSRYPGSKLIDYSAQELDGIYLEGTGALVLDHQQKIAFCVKSPRAHESLFYQWCTDFQYEGILFDAHDPHGIPVYHTNVIMGIATDFALIGLSLINDSQQRKQVEKRLAECGRDFIALSPEQIAKFAGNTLELQTDQGKVLALSQTAFNALNSSQIKIIEKSARLLPINVPTIEHSGGSIRCMLAGIHL